MALTTSCTQPVLKKVSVPEARNLISKQTDKLQIVDLRTPEEIAESGKIAGAVNIDFTAPSYAQAINRLDKKRPVLLYCAAGGRSGAAAQQMHQSGFMTVYDMASGMTGWLAAKAPVSH